MKYLQILHFFHEVFSSTMNNYEHPIVAISVSKKFSNRSYHQKHKRSRKTVLLSFVKSNWNKSGMSKHNRTILSHNTSLQKDFYCEKERKKCGSIYIVIFTYICDEGCMEKKLYLRRHLAAFGYFFWITHQTSRQFGALSKRVFPANQDLP